jgi:hypothetical protein
MCSDPNSNNPEDLEREIKDSIEKVRGLRDELKIVQEHERTILELDEDEDEPPLFQK